MSTFNTNQQIAIQSVDGKVMVIACPGSGKTTVVIARAYQLIKKGIQGENILVITFTKEAAAQLKERYEKKYGNHHIFFGTIHSICFRILAKSKGYTKEDILLGSEQWEFFRQYFFKRAETTDLEEFIRKYLGELSYLRNTLLPISPITVSVCEPALFKEAQDAYEQYKKISGKLDFDDMLVVSRDILQTDAQCLTFWKNQFPYIMIDEYQDTNKVQSDIFNMLSGETGNLFIVGDDDQSIYKFRGADFQNFLNFPSVNPKCKTINLDTNYRSTANIINRAGALIGHNTKRFKKSFFSNSQENGLIRVTAYDSVTTQALHITSLIKKMHQYGGNLDITYKQCSILYRANAQNQLLIGAFLKNSIPFYTTEPPIDYHNDFIFQDIMAYYRLANDSYKKGDLQRILNRPSRYLKADHFSCCAPTKEEMLKICKDNSCSSNNIQSVLELLEDLKSLKGLSPKDFCSYLLHTMKYFNFILTYSNFCKRDVDVVKDLLQVLLTEGENYNTMNEWESYANYYATVIMEKRKDKSKNGVCLSTMHASKGLEWENVFIIDSNEDVCPYIKASSFEDLEEERRLYYVACTRAKKNLYISYVSSKGNKLLYPSRYLEEMNLLHSVKRISSTDLLVGEKNHIRN